MELGAGEVVWRGEPRSTDRLRLPPTKLRNSQRERILEAMLDCVAEHGYEATTVAQVAASAGVSRIAFHEYFEDKLDCFVAACDAALGELLSELFNAMEERNWTVAVHGATEIYLRWWEARPALAHAYFVELAAAGERAIGQRESIDAQLRALFRALGQRARNEQLELAPLPSVAPKALVMAITGLVEDEVRAGRAERLGELAAEVVFLVVKLLADDATAQRALQARTGPLG